MEKPKPFWWPETPAFIAILLVASVVCLAFVLAFRAPDGDMFKFMIGGLMTTGFASIIGFYFGSSQGSKDKDTAMAKIATGDANPPPQTNGTAVHQEPKP